MKRFLAKLVHVSFGTCVFATAAIAQTPVSPPGVWPFNITTSGSYRLTANMLAPAASSAIVISANNVTLDLNGFTVSQSGLVTLCGPDTTAGYGSTCAPGAGPPLINATGRSIKIRNGIVTNGPGPGIVASSSAPTFEDLDVTGNRGAGITVIGEGGRFSRINALYNAGLGISAATQAHVEDVLVSWNDGMGISMPSFGIASRVIARANGQSGFFGGAVVDHLVAQDNHLSGFNGGGVVRNVVSQDNDDTDAVGGLLLDSHFYTGDVYVNGCYAQTSANAILGPGVPMTSNTCP